MWIAGVMQGMMWRAVNPDGTLVYTFVESVKATFPYYVVRFAGGLLYLGGMVLMAWNVVMTVRSGQAVPALIPRVAAAHGHDDVPSHHQHSGEIDQAAEQAHDVEGISRLDTFDEAVDERSVGVDGTPHQALHHARDPHRRDVQHHAGGRDPEVQRDQPHAVHLDALVASGGLVLCHGGVVLVVAGFRPAQAWA